MHAYLTFENDHSSVFAVARCDSAGSRIAGAPTLDFGNIAAFGTAQLDYYWTVVSSHSGPLAPNSHVHISVEPAFASAEFVGDEHDLTLYIDRQG